ncbi:MAG TPA: tetratricopeptide repeat protein, partial [Gemmatimonadaceae bacterium]|nr:tetratricopeptide repeat protein [Gemmatimonadaceae bacterium]
MMLSLRTIRAALAAAPLALAVPAALAAQTSPVRLATSRPVAVADAARDSAIAKLEDFLSEYPNSPLRPNALFQLGELLVRQAEEEFTAAMRDQAADTAQRREALIKPDYAPAIRVYEELVRRYPNFEQIDAAAYTLGTLYAGELRYADAARMFEMVAARPDSRFRGEAFFRLGDAYFEMAAGQRGTQRRALFARAAAAYEQATQINPPTSDIYFLALYKLGWSYYNQATQAQQAEYQKAVDVFGRLVAAYDQLSPEQQSRLGLRGEAIEYMAIAFTQVGGAQAAQQYFSSRGGVPYQTTVLRRVATGLRDQGDFPRAVEAFRTLLEQAPTDSSALSVQREIVDIYQNRMIEFDSAQAARLRLIENFGPGSAWAQANPGLAAQAAQAREEALRQAGQYALSRAQAGRDRARYAEAAQLYSRYMSEFAQSDSAQQVNYYYGAALVGQGEFAQAGEQFARTAFDYSSGNSTLALEAGRNAIVAYDSALSRNRDDRATQDAFFATVDRFVGIAPPEVAQQALIQKGRRASETKRWDVLEQTFRNYVQRFPDDDYAPQAQKLIGDALYQQGKYAEAQVQWEAAQQYASTRGRRSLADSISTLRTRAAVSFADTLIRQGNYERAAEEVYVALADKNPRSERAPGALRDAIETYLLADSAARQRGDAAASQQARRRAIELSNRLVTQYPNYQYRSTYQALAIRLTGETGNPE